MWHIAVALSLWINYIKYLSGAELVKPIRLALWCIYICMCVSSHGFNNICISVHVSWWQKCLLVFPDTYIFSKRKILRLHFLSLESRYISKNENLEFYNSEICNKKKRNKSSYLISFMCFKILLKVIIKRIANE